MGGGVCKSVKEGVYSFASAAISFASGASGAPNVVAGLCSWARCYATDTSLEVHFTCPTSGASPKRNTLFQNVLKCKSTSLLLVKMADVD